MLVETIQLAKVGAFLRRSVLYTGWLKLKYPTEQNAISRQPCKIFIPKFLGLYGIDPATIVVNWKFVS